MVSNMNPTRLRSFTNSTSFVCLLLLILQIEALKTSIPQKLNQNLLLRKPGSSKVKSNVQSDNKTSKGYLQNRQAEKTENAPTVPKRRYDAYKQAALMIRASMNPTVNPCDDFFEYACGRYKKNASAIELNVAKLYRQLGLEINKIKNRSKMNSFTAKASQFYKSCKSYYTREGTDKTDDQVGNLMLKQYTDLLKTLKTKEMRRIRRAAKRKRTVRGIIKSLCARITILMFPDVKDRFGAERLKLVKKSSQTRFERKIQRMFKNIKQSMISMVQPATNFTNVNRATKTLVMRRVLRKLRTLSLAIGWPCVVNDEELDQKYKKLEIKKTDTFLEQLNKLANYSIARDVEELQGTGLPKLNTVKNVIDIPWNLLVPPFFDRRWPISLNYGALGQIIGHESAHALTDMLVEKKKKQKNNQVAPIIELLKKISICLVNEYSNFCPLKGTGLKLECLNGGRTLVENIADNVGLLAAYAAYEQEAKVKKEPKSLTELFGNSTQDQLFFLGYAQMFCEPATDQEFTLRQIQSDNHSPFKYRLLGSVKNSPQFYSAFHCLPQTRCFSKNSKT